MGEDVRVSGPVTNGMSYHARDGVNANAAVVVSVGPEDFDGSSVFAGMEFQRRIERAAYQATGSYCVPCQRVGDFVAEVVYAVAGAGDGEGEVYLAVVADAFDVGGTL